MNGLVLLDERQQRELYPATSIVSTPSQTGYRSTTSSNEARRLPRGRGSIVSSQGSEPRTDFRSRGDAPASPRTNFTTTGGGGNGRFCGGSPRTNFTTRASSQVDFANDEGLPRTDFTSGKPSVSTNLTTSSTEPTHRNRYDILGNPTADSYPMLRHSDSESSTDADSAQANRYAGASSGLKISVTYIMIGVVAGVVLGVLLSHFEVSALAAQWVSLPGDLFLRALKCLVVPYVFCSVAVAIGDIVFVGKVSVVGLQTAKVFFIFWLVTVTMGVGVGLLFRPLFQRDMDAAAKSTDKVMGFLCPNNQTVAMLANESIACLDTASVSSSPASLFTILDVNSVVKVNTKNQIAELSLGDQIMGMITPIVSSNILASMANSDLLSIITFAMVLGSIAGRSYFTKSRRVNYLYLVLLQLRNAFFLALEWTIWLTPVAVVSIIAGTFATNQNALRQSGNVYVYVAAVVAATLLQVLVLLPAIVFLMARCNPYNHMRGMLRAYIFAFACSSSLATAPVTLTCVKKARVCSHSLANFVISIGVTSNLSAAGFYFPIAVIFLAESSGNGDKINALHVVGIFVLSLLSCAGTPPIPAAGLVTISTIYSTVFGVSEMPSTFVYVAAVDFLVDRFATVCNVNDDIMALKMIAENTDETVTQDQLGERF